MTAKKIIELIKAFNEEVGGDELRVYRRYSGRGMHNRACIGFTTGDSRGLLGIVSHLTALCDEDDRDELVEHFDVARTDNLGHNVIVYFPNIEDGPDEDEEPTTETDPV